MITWCFPRLPRLQLRATALLTLVLLLGPAVALLLLPRPRAVGLERLLPQAALLQSFPAASERPVPALWQQRLGRDQAQRLWRQQRGMWWQFWGRDGDGGAFLALPARAVGALPKLAVSPLVVDDLLVVAPDPLSRRQLQDQLRSGVRQRQGLERRCLQPLQQQQTVFWGAVGFAQLTGPVAPLLQSVRQGCLTLEPAGRRLASGLDFQGEVAGSSGVLAGAPSPGGLPPESPLAGDALLELTGPKLAPLLSGLLARQLIREPLAARYGLGPAQQSLLISVPFRLRLRAIPQGPFQAGLELQLAVGPRREAWAAMLQELRRALLNQDLQDAPPRLQPAAAARQKPGARSATLPASSFQREDGVVVGGWRWRSAAGGAPELLLFLGPEPPLDAPLPAPVRDPRAMHLKLHPALLARLGLMPPGLPQLVRQARQIEIGVSPADQPISWLVGRLRM